MLQTVIPLYLAISTSILLNPVPASAINLTESGKALIISPLTGISLVTITSQP